MLIYEKIDKIKDLIVFKPEIYYDFRGENFETYNEEYLKVIKKETGKNIKFKVDTHSYSRKWVIRAFHGDKFNYKLIQVLKGDIYSVILDLRLNSPTYNNHFTINLNERNRYQIFIPVGCLNGYLCLSDDCVYSYKLSYKYIDQKNQITRKWNDERHKIFWPVKNPILSERDS